MERETQPQRVKLLDVVAADYPASSEIGLSFPEKWELVERLQREAVPFYVAALPPTPERPRRTRFPGLTDEVNLEMNRYRLYKLFQPWPMPQLTIRWHEMQGLVRVESVDGFTLQLQPIGQAQVWQGRTSGLIWECYLYGAPQGEMWPQEMAAFWQAVEKDMGVAQLFTQPHEPTWDVDEYQRFLDELGYMADATSSGWWRKSFAQSNSSST